MGAVKSFLESKLPSVYVHSIRIGDSEEQDKEKGFFDQIGRQVNEVCERLKQDARLSQGFNAIGLSQGGLLLRAYVERCNHPPVHNLVTFGSPHGGVSDLPGCKDISDTRCRLARALIDKGVYLSWVQSRVVQAQYFRDWKKMDQYLQANAFLPDINSELDTYNVTYRENLKSLNAFVMIQFANDTTLVPRQSAWFSTQDAQGKLVPLQQQDALYKQDRLGLKYLEQNGRLVLLERPGHHSTLDILEKDILGPYLSQSLTPVLVHQAN